MVAGLPATLGLEATDPHGSPIILKGTIQDMHGTKVADFESLDLGLGSVGFTPLPNTRYYASVLVDGHEETYPLPDVDAEGYVLSIKNRGDELLVQVATNTATGLEGTLLVGHLRGNLIFQRIGTAEDRNAYAARLYTDALADGVAQFTLFAPDGEPLCERLVFVDVPDNEVNLAITPNANRYGLRDKVSLDLALADGDGKPLQGDFSLGVVTRSSDLDYTGTDIKSWLLLDSDLGGTVPGPRVFLRGPLERAKGTPGRADAHPRMAPVRLEGPPGRRGTQRTDLPARKGHHGYWAPPPN